MRIVFELKRGEQAEVILNNLYKNTQLQISFGIINLSIVHGQPRELNLIQTIKYFIEHRADVVRRRTDYELRKARERGLDIPALPNKPGGPARTYLPSTAIAKLLAKYPGMDSQTISERLNGAGIEHSPDSIAPIVSRLRNGMDPDARKATYAVPARRAPRLPSQIVHEALDRDPSLNNYALLRIVNAEIGQHAPGYKADLNTIKQIRRRRGS
jgi:hypothetical protein